KHQGQRPWNGAIPTGPGRTCMEPPCPAKGSGCVESKHHGDIESSKLMVHFQRALPSHLHQVAVRQNDIHEAGRGTDDLEYRAVRRGQCFCEKRSSQKEYRGHRHEEQASAPRGTESIAPNSWTKAT